MYAEFLDQICFQNNQICLFAFIAPSPQES